MFASKDEVICIIQTEVMSEDDAIAFVYVFSWTLINNIIMFLVTKNKIMKI